MKKRKYAITKPAGAEPDGTVTIEEIRHMAAQAVLESPQPEAEAVAELIGRLERLSPLTAARVLMSLAQETGEKALPLLEKLALAPAVPQTGGIRLAAVEALAALRSERGAQILAHIADKDADKDLRKRAKRALFKLRGLGLALSAPAAGPAEVKEKFPILRSLLSSYDYAGTRAIMFGVERPFGGVDRIVLLANAVKGLTDCSGVQTSREAFAEQMERMRRLPDLPGGLWADAPASHCQQLVQEALALNRKSGTPVPRGYYYWKDEIGQPAEYYDWPLVYREITALEVKWEPTLLEQSADLLARPELLSWAFDPHQVERYYFELQQSRKSAIALPGWSQKERDDATMRRLFEEVVPPDRHAAYKRQMEEMACMYLRLDRRLDAKRALAVAVALDEHKGGELIKIPFFRELLSRTFALIERERRGGARLTPRDLGLVTLGDLLPR
ncbi:MAG: hypothetical protein HYX94_11240 [Chloroflexi bacterium]|nr:hypothetical protein [Chloroflexota bacterium]